MQTSVSKKLKIGLFTVAGILLFVIGVFVIGSKKNMFSDTFMIYGTFNNVGGLEVGNNIRFAGINVGTIEEVSIVSDTMIRVDMRMKEKVRPFLKEDAMASISSDGLMGDKLITIRSGFSNELKILTNGSRILTANPVDFDKVIGTFTKVADNANIITGELANMAVQIRKGNGTISKLLYTDDLSKSLEGTATNAKIITGELANMAVQIRKGNGTISKLLYTDDLSRSLEGTASNAEKITGSLAGITAHVRSGKGTMGSLVYSDSLSNGLEKTTTTANATMLTMREAAYDFSENMKALQGNFFLRGYFRRKAREKDKNVVVPEKAVVSSDGVVSQLNEEELKEVIASAQKALEAKHKP
ncbi:MlaD family protein [Segetibacter koreensis]|uniref:MlaD family protein n=1 Tax=Segetibacter koreensis TaxID=398037 RepID=UPI00036D101B|nr:MlaD family protein [Segetibacter koreensis]